MIILNCTALLTHSYNFVYKFAKYTVQLHKPFPYTIIAPYFTRLHSFRAPVWSSVFQSRAAERMQTYTSAAFVVDLLVLRHQTVRGLLSLAISPPALLFLLYEEKYLFPFIKAFYPRERGNCCVGISGCVCMCECVGGCRAMLGVIMKRLKCDKRLL